MHILLECDSVEGNWFFLMKTKILFLSFLLVFVPHLVEAGWYPGGTFAIANGNCPTDGENDVTWPAPADTPPYAGWVPYYLIQARVVGGTPGANITCEFWDTTSPTIFASNNSPLWKPSNILTTFTASHNGGSSLLASSVKYRWDNSDCVGGWNIFVSGDVNNLITEWDHVLYLCASDIAGNTQTWNGQYRLDKTDPVVSASGYSASWRTSDITVFLYASDALSGLNASTVKYRWDNADCVGWGTVFSDGSFITLSTEWTHTLYLCAADNAGHTTTWSNGNFRLDKTNPVLSADNISALWRNVNIPIQLTATDAWGSWLNPSTVKYRWDNADCVGWGTVFSHGNNITLSTEWQHTLYLCAADNAGNTFTWNSNQYKLDKTNPTVSANNFSLIWKNADISIQLTVNDSWGSALNPSTVKYRWDNADCVGWGTVFVHNDIIILSTEWQHTLYLCAADNAGNTVTWNETRYRLDKTNPVLLADNTSPLWKNADISIQLTATDAWGSALNPSTVKYRWDNADCVGWGSVFSHGNNITLSTEWQHTLYLCAADNAGNTFTWNSNQYKLDKTNPVLLADNTSVLWKNADISIQLTATDAWGSALNPSTVKYRWDNADCVGWGTVFNHNDTIILSTEWQHTLYLCAADNAGNTMTWNSNLYKLDKTPPTASSLTYANGATNGWTNNTTISVNWLVNDPAPSSGIQNHDVRVYESNTPQNPVAWNLIGTFTTAWAAPNYSYIGTNGRAYKFEVCPRDTANNVCVAWTTSPDISRIDTTTPNENNLNMATAILLLATGSQDFDYTFNDGWAPITLVGQIEDYNNPAWFLPSFASPPHAFAHKITHDISKVDIGWDRSVDSNTARPYTHTITQICDQAWNCWNGSKSYTYNVYSNPSYNYTLVGNNTAFTLLPVAADGTIKTWQAQLLDGFGNIIIPSPGINRVVSYDLSAITNTMYLNQYLRSWPTSVYVIPTTGAEVWLETNPTQSLGNQVSTNGEYPLWIRVYTPTSNGHVAPDQVSDPNATFSFDINITVDDTLISAPQSASHGSPVFRFEPLFRTVFDEELDDGWFIEWTEQSSEIDVIQNILAPAPPLWVGSEIVELTFSGTEANKFDFYANSAGPVSTAITDKTQFTVSPSYSLWTVNGYPFKSQLVQKPSVIVTNLSNLWLTTHLSYTLDGKNITTNSDSIGKDSYFWAATPNLGSQVWVKIIWAVSSKYINNMIDGQFQSGTILVNYQSRSEVRNKIKKNIALAVRNASGSVVGTAITNIAGLPSGAWATWSFIRQSPLNSILYIEKNGWDIVLSTGAVSWIRTIVVRWANLWIMRDMYYTDTQSILGVVVQKDDNGNGGNLYVSPGITNMVGTYVLDGSIISYNGFSELWFNTPASTLRNQLLIYGSIVSENSIGWSRAATPICPTLIPLWACTLEVAQTYDLNYLRRYYLVGNNPSIGSVVIGWWTCGAGICGTFDPKLKKLFTNTSHDLARYPLIIEYNPLIQRTPPIGFGNALSE
jgi:hypothetical protein